MLGGLQAIHEMIKLVKKHNPLVLFLIMTKRKSAEMEWLRFRWCFDNYSIMDYVGRCGGLALLWMNEALVEVLFFSNQYIDARIGDLNSDNAWRFTSFYGSPEVNQRCRSRDMLRQLHNHSSLPWLCTGDFNDILSYDEKMRGALRLS